MRPFRRSAALLVAAAALILSSQAALAGPTVPAEKQTGSVGPYAISDGPALTAALCRYSDTLPLTLRRITVKAPKVYWPDTDSNVSGQHGKVRHRIVVQRSTDGGTSWKYFAASTTQSATAYENQAAPLTLRAVNVPGGDKHTRYRAVSRIQWVRADGSVRGTLLHWYANARWASDQLQGTIEPAPCYAIG